MNTAIRSPVEHSGTLEGLWDKGGVMKEKTIDRVLGINIDYVKSNEREKFLKGEVVGFVEGKIKLATEEEIKSLEDRFDQKRPELSKGFYFATWV